MEDIFETIWDIENSIYRKSQEDKEGSENVFSWENRRFKKMKSYFG